MADLPKTVVVNVETHLDKEKLLLLAGAHYQLGVEATAIYPGQGEITGIMYTGLGASGELGEVTEIIKKVWRKGYQGMPEEQTAKLQSEIGDVMWYLAQLCNELNISLGQVMLDNLGKLAARREAGTLDSLAGERKE